MDSIYNENFALHLQVFACVNVENAFQRRC